MLLAAVTLILTTGLRAERIAIPDFTFIHISDEHSGAGGATSETIADLARISGVRLEPYGVDALPPTFVIETGDMTEFGPKGGSWDALNRWYSATGFTRFRALGNHDSTWRSLRPEITRLYGAPYYSFDRYRCHFAVLDSAGLQDPRPVISPEELDWLRADLARVGSERPVFVALHHPLDGTEFSSKYEVDRLLDALRPYNIALVMVGHGHAAVYSRFDGLDMVEGGSAYGPGPAGYQIVSVLDGTLRVAYKELGKADATEAMIEKSLAVSSRYPKITIESPVERKSYRGKIRVRASIDGATDQVKEAYAEVDGSMKVALTAGRNATYASRASVDLKPGAHSLKVSFVSGDGAVYHRSTSFYVDSRPSMVRWRTFLGAASRSTPAVRRNLLLAGTNDGFVRALSLKSGREAWRTRSGGAVTDLLVLGDRVFFGSEDGYLYCVSARTGALVWRLQAGDPIYSGVVSDGSSVYFGCGSGAFYALSAVDGTVLWKNTDARYNIESRPFVSGGKVYFGAWDTYVYCLDASDGRLLWKRMGKGSSEGSAPAYYSPADCGPVVCGGMVYVADRKFRLSVTDASTGALLRSQDGVSAVGVSSDGMSVYLRRTNGKLAKVDARGREQWSVEASMDYMPSPPVESGGVVYACSGRGLVSAVSADDGKILRQYQITPRSFVAAGIGAHGGSAFVIGTDGVLTVLTR